MRLFLCAALKETSWLLVSMSEEPGGTSYHGGAKCPSWTWRWMKRKEKQHVKSCFCWSLGQNPMDFHGFHPWRKRKKRKKATSFSPSLAQAFTQVTGCQQFWFLEDAEYPPPENSISSLLRDAHPKAQMCGILDLAESGFLTISW